MSITDELREQAKWLSRCDNITKPYINQFFCIADRIDAEHEAQLKDAFETRNSDENQENDGWIRLPRVADNKIVNVGDKLDGYNKTIEVMWLRLGRTGWWIIDKYGKSYACCDEFSHHHEPTVEDVLNEMCDALNDVRMPLGSGMLSEEIIAEYAAKLQLRGDGE